MVVVGMWAISSVRSAAIRLMRRRRSSRRMGMRGVWGAMRGGLVESVVGVEGQLLRAVLRRLGESGMRGVFVVW